MRIHTPESLAGRYQERLITSSSIELRDAITDDRMLFSTLRDADVLLLPVNFDKTTVEYIRYSMPTKVPAYLTSGTPILVYGPSDVAQVQYAREAGWGQIVSEQGVEPLARGIRRLIEDEQLRERISRKARLAAQLNHDSRNVRTRFQATLREAAASKRAQTV